MKNTNNTRRIGYEYQRSYFRTRFRRTARYRMHEDNMLCKKFREQKLAFSIPKSNIFF